MKQRIRSRNQRLIRRHRLARVGLVLSVVAVTACGDDGNDAAVVTDAPATDAPATDPPATDPPATDPPATDPPGTDAPTSEIDEYCALAVEMDSGESFPTAEQMTRYREIAPDEISAAATVAADALIPVADDPVAFFNAFALDEVEVAIEQLDTYEQATCGLEGDGEDPEGSSKEIETDAARVDVIATDYAFSVPEGVEPGRTSFVLVNEGKEAHFLLILKLKDGVTIDQALEADFESDMVEGEWSTGAAAAGGDDEEVVTFDLDPGTYGLLCFVSGPDGTPHAFMGMKTELVVG